MSLSVALRHAFGAFDLDLAFEAPHGITVLYGRSGSGKTTIVNALAGLLRPDAGRIAVDDWVIFDSDAGIDLPPHARRVGYIFQDARLFPHLNVRQNLKYGRWFASRSGTAPDMGHIVDMLGLGHLLDRRPAGLSGGETQRVAIGRALLADPRLTAERGLFYYAEGPEDGSGYRIWFDEVQFETLGTISAPDPTIPGVSLEEELNDTLALPKSAVCLKSGQTSRRKVLEVTGALPEQVAGLAG